MKIEAVDFFYLSMPQVTDEADGSQDALLVRVAAGGHVGWGECEAAPLPSIAAFVCPMSHGVCRPVGDSVLGRTLESAADIAAHVGRRRLRQHGPAAGRPHLVGRRDGDVGPAGQGARRAGVEAARLRAQPSQDALRLGAVRRDPAGDPGARKAHPRRWLRARPSSAGARSAAAARRRTADQLMAAREGLGPDALLLVDVGQIFIEDVERAAERLPALEAARATWLEEPFPASAYARPTRALARRSGRVKLAGGEGAHDVHMARHLIDYGGVGFIQIDCGRIGGIGPAKQVADYAAARGVTYVNHTFTSQPGAVGLAAALRRPRRSPHLRVSRGHQARRAGLHAQPHRPRRQRRGRARRRHPGSASRSRRRGCGNISSMSRSRLPGRSSTARRRLAEAGRGTELWG